MPKSKDRSADAPGRTKPIEPPAIPATYSGVTLDWEQHCKLCELIEAIPPKDAHLVLDYLLNGFNGTKAAISAGFKPSAARTIASEKLAKPNISAIVNLVQRAVISAKILTIDRRKVMCSQAAEDCFKGHGQFMTVLPDGEVVHDINEDNRNSLALKRVKQQFKTIGEEGEGSEDVRTVDIETRDFLPYVQELNKMEGVYAESEPDSRGAGMTVNFNIIAAGPRQKPAIDVPSEVIESPRMKKTFALAVAKKAGA